MTNAAPRGKPDAGNPHVRFDEGEVAPAATPRRGSLLYDKKQMVGLRACRVAALGAWSLAALAGHGATDGTWASATDGGSWADPANWVGGVLPNGGVATFNWTGQTNRIEVTGAGEIPLTALNIRGAILPRANSESVFSGMTFVFSDPATMTVARANFAFHANTLACAGRLVLSGTDGRVALHDP